jgi:hypothetical protein
MEAHAEVADVEPEPELEFDGPAQTFWKKLLA